MPGPNNTSTADNAAAVPVPNPAAAIMGRASDRPNGWGMPVDSRSPIASPAQPQNLNDRHSIFDRGLLHVAHSLEGKQPDYVTDTTTGEVKEVVTPRKPGGLFRDIILEAMAAVLPAQTPCGFRKARRFARWCARISWRLKDA